MHRKLALDPLDGLPTPRLNAVVTRDESERLKDRNVEVKPGREGNPEKDEFVVGCDRKVRFRRANLILQVCCNKRSPRCSNEFAPGRVLYAGCC